MNQVTTKKRAVVRKAVQTKSSKAVKEEASVTKHKVSPVEPEVCTQKTFMLKNIPADVLSRLLELDYHYLNPDVAIAGVDPIKHFHANGYAEERSISILFDSAYILSVSREKKEILSNNDEFELDGMDVNRHYSEIVLEEGNMNIAPISWMDLHYIRENNSGFKDSTVAELLLGILDGVVTKIHPLFDELFYRKQAASRDIEIDQPALLHYFKQGWRMGLDPHPLFDSWYFYENGGPQHDQAPLLTYLRAEIPWAYSISPFVDEGYLNHCLVIQNKECPKGISPLTFALQLPDVSADILHPHLTKTVLDYVLHGDVVPPYEIKAETSLEVFKKIISSLRFPEKNIVEFRDEIDVSVIIVNYRKPVLTLLSVISALQALENISHEILLVDNDGTAFENEVFFRYLRAYSTVRVVPTSKNLYFGEGNNIAIDMAQGKYVLFLNNDAFVDSRSMLSLLQTIDEDESIGAVAPVMFDAGLHIGEVGGMVSKFGEVVQQAKGRELDKVFFEKLIKMGADAVDYVSAACMLIRTNFLRQFGGFDYRFEPFYYEDTDLCMRIKKSGLKTVVVGSAYCLHLENTSTREFLAGKFNSIVGNSREKFFSRWVLDNEENCGIVDCAIIDRPTNHKKSIAIYTPFHITLGGGENYILSLAAEASTTMNVTVVTEERTSRTRFAFVLRDLGIEAFPFNIATRDDVQGVIFDSAIVMGNEIVPPWVPAARNFIYHCQFPFPVNHSTRHFFGKNSRVDAYVVNSEFTRDAMISQFGRYKIPEKEVIILSPPVNISKKKLGDIGLLKFPKEQVPVKFASIGRFFASGHCKRQDVIARVLSRVSLKHNIFAEIYGGLSTTPADQDFFQNVKMHHDGERIVVDANVGRDLIEQCFEHAHYYIHAAGLGVNTGIHPHQCEHFGITVVEAMANGCIPIVYSIGGPAEIVRKAGVGYLYSTEQELEEIVSRLAQDGVRGKKQVLQMSEAVKFAQDFRRSRFYEDARAIFERVLKD